MCGRGGTAECEYKNNLIYIEWSYLNFKNCGMCIMSSMTDENDRKLNDRKWNLLIKRIKDKKCTPFLGAGACHPCLPLGSDIALDWAKQYEYPFDDSWDLVRVAQFLAIMNDSMFPKEEMAKLIKNKKMMPNFNYPYELHGVLADLPLPIYLTTNYDDFMVKALETRKKDVKREFSRWNKSVMNDPSPSIFESTTNVFDPTPQNPVVFHLHGIDEVEESIVITRDDYLDFLVGISEANSNIIPNRIDRVFGGTTLLFLGYGIDDWNLLVILRKVAHHLGPNSQRTHISVQLAPGDNDEQKEYARRVMDKYFKDLRIQVYWGTCDDFAKELRRRWEEFEDGI